MVLLAAKETTHMIRPASPPMPDEPSRVSAHGPGLTAVLDLDAELAALAAMSLAQLRQRWSELTGRPIPRVGQMLLRMALGWELQASVYGGLSRRSTQRLVQMAAASGLQPAAMKLTREWKGTLHTVTVAGDDTIHWNGKVWNSLSEVARAITGTRWSGPVFFGLRKGKAA